MTQLTQALHSVAVREAMCNANNSEGGEPQDGEPQHAAAQDTGAQEERPEDWPGGVFDDVIVYLICGHKRFDIRGKNRTGTRRESEPYLQFTHYLGATSNLKNRLYMHRTGRGGKKTAAMVEQGIRLKVTRTWCNFNCADDAWRYEKVLKRQCNNLAKLCPVCRNRYLKHHNKWQRDRRSIRNAAKRATGQMALPMKTKKLKEKTDGHSLHRNGDSAAACRECEAAHGALLRGRQGDLFADCAD